MDLTSPKKIRTAQRGTVRRGKLRQVKGGPHAESLCVVRRVQTEVLGLLAREPEPEGGESVFQIVLQGHFVG